MRFHKMRGRLKREDEKEEEKTKYEGIRLRENIEEG
jgi:hypothetical protein